MPKLKIIELKDLDMPAIRRALEAFGIEQRFDAIAVAVLDPGFAPPGMSNRLFRFDHLRQLMARNKELATFAYFTQELPDYLTRMKAVAESVDVDVPLLLLDTGVAAALGALQDSQVSQHEEVLTVNLGNAHTITFLLHGNSVRGFFEHHTRLLDVANLDSLIAKLARGTLSNDEVYHGGGHGALVFDGCRQQPFVATTGPRQDVIERSSLKPHRAVPHGDTMLAGCYGLISACALRMDDWREEIQRALAGNS
jgi:uncharacterized protein (DUF1786 family)